MHDSQVQILMPVHNGQRFLARQLESILAQSYERWRLIAFDDGSTDESWGILESFARSDARIATIRGGRTIGIVLAIRELARAVPKQTLYAAFSDQDDVWYRDKLSIVMRKMASVDDHARPILVHADSSVTDEGLAMIKTRFVSGYARVPGLFASLLYCSVQGASSLINRPMIDIVAQMPSDILWYDRYMHLAAEFLGERYFIDRPLMLYRQHSHNALGASGESRKVFIFRYPQSEPWLASNERAIDAWSKGLDCRKRGQQKAYRMYARGSSPILRLAIAVRFLWAHPAILLKEAVRALSLRMDGEA
jgi:rhamnosyltransferase